MGQENETGGEGGGVDPLDQPTVYKQELWSLPHQLLEINNRTAFLRIHKSSTTTKIQRGYSRV